MAGSRMDIGFQVFRKTLELGIMSGWSIQRSDRGGCGTRTRSPVFVRNPRCAVSSAIRGHASSPLPDGAGRATFQKAHHIGQGAIVQDHQPVQMIGHQNIAKRFRHALRL